MMTAIIAELPRFVMSQVAIAKEAEEMTSRVDQTCTVEAPAVRENRAIHQIEITIADITIDPDRQHRLEDDISRLPAADGKTHERATTASQQAHINVTNIPTGSNITPLLHITSHPTNSNTTNIHT